MTIVAPPTLLPPSLSGWSVDVSHDLDRALAGADVVMADSRVDQHGARL